MSDTEGTSALGSDDTIVTEQLILTRGFNGDGGKIISLEIAEGEDYIIHLGMLEAAKMRIIELQAEAFECTCDDDDDEGPDD